MAGNNYKNRRARGQCATCTEQSAGFRCDECRKKLNDYLREWRFNQSIRRENRLDELDKQLAAEVRELTLRHS